MTDGLPMPTKPQLLGALRLLGWEPEQPPADAGLGDEERSSELLGELVAVTQALAARREQHAELVLDAYHAAQARLGAGSCGCCPPLPLSSE